MRRLSALVGAAALALSVAACGGGDDGGSTTSSSSPAESSTVDPATLSAELTWWDTSDPTNEGPAFQELIAKFNETYPNVKINYQSVPFAEARKR